MENALMSAATYMIVKDRGANVRSEKTKRVREILEVLGAFNPERLELVNR